MNIPTAPTPAPGLGPHSTFEDVTVTQVSPLRIQRDGDSNALDITPDSLLPTSALVTGDRVRVENADGRLIVHGRADGPYDSGWVTTGFSVGAGAASIGAANIRRVGDVVTLTINTIVISAGISADVFGNLANTIVAVLPEGFEPTHDQVIGSYGSGPIASFYIAGGTRNVYLAAVAPDATWTASTTFTGTVSCGGVYLLG